MRRVKKPIDVETMLLGDALKQITSNIETAYPSVNETTFKHRVAPLLANLGAEGLLQRYQEFVGVLTAPLRVVSDTNIEQTLFVVPAIVQSPRTTIPLEGGLTVSQMYKAVARDIELGQRRKAELKILSFLSNMVVLPDYQAAVIDPLTKILAQYDYTLTLDSLALPADAMKPQGAQATAIPAESSFVDEYEED